MQTGRRVAGLMLPPVLWLVALFVLPVALMAVFSFRAGTFGAEREIFTLAHYQKFLGDASLHRLFLTSAGIALQVSVGAVLLAYPLGYFLAFRAGRWRNLLLTLIIVPAWTSYLLRVLAWKLILSSNGLLNSLLVSVGLIQAETPILLYSSAAVVITLIYVWTPFVAMPIASALQRIEPRLLEAAADLGCPPWQTFWRVTLPLSLPGVWSGFFFVFIPTLGEYVTPMLVGGAQGTMYGNLIQDQFARALNWPMGALMSLVMLAAVLVLLAGFSRVARLSDLAGV